MSYLIIWVIMGALVSIIANSKGRNAALWFAYGALIWPVALIHASLLKPETQWRPQGPKPGDNLQQRERDELTAPKHWFLHRDRRVEVADDGSALVDGMTFPDADKAKEFLNRQYPDRHV